MHTKMQYDKALSFWTVSFEYLMLVENVAREIAAQGNNWIIVDDYPIEEAEYEERTRWSDHCIIIPLLFNLYHGIELLAKGFLLADGCMRAGHKLLKLRQLFSEKYPDERELNSFFAKYTDPQSMSPILKEFLDSNHLGFQDLYEALRYPSDPNFNAFNSYINLKYKGKDGIEFFNGLQQDIISARIAARETYGLILEQEANTSN